MFIYQRVYKFFGPKPTSSYPIQMIQHIHAIEKTGEPMEKQRTFPPKQPKLIEDSGHRSLATKHLFRLHRFRIRIFTDQPGPGRRRPIPGNLARCHGCKILHLWLMNFQL